ncbi:hypothetical protein BD324DRAFT_683340 [Kockovaella imperatae]|uniref:RING-type domain-containing protein n=1 Tax=Kockovaella imperatae TaxID=4999 RepID=A0A1Y1U8P3_9TREE|nr:hypothetical protein BD324DRAFT_683340 [Kockovaella imperatae]ORX34388.1 hypothetical protein BD324DRAFT_683340 [Kockovaella imperatae]
MEVSPSRIPLPHSPRSGSSQRSSLSSHSWVSTSLISPIQPIRPHFDRQETSATVRQNGPTDPFLEGSTISVNQPVGSLSISPSNRDVCLASRKGLYILDLANLNNAPRFIPQGGTWQIADCQWSPHPVTSNLILSTSSQKLLVWDLAAPKSLHSSIDAHARAITDIQWHALNPNLMATISMDSGIRGWDLRTGDKPFMRMAAWGQAGTQVKWNRQHEYILATANGKQAIIWDTRKGSVPLVSVQAHDSKIYGLDWDRQYRDKFVTCSLDKSIKFWTIPELATSRSALADFYSIPNPPASPTHTITTNYPVWRARNLPFGRGVLALPQRGEQALEMFGLDGDGFRPVERFEGHDDVVKEFVWRNRGGLNSEFDDREFQLVSWSKDRTLRIWPVSRQVTERVGYQYGRPIRVLMTRQGAADITYTRLPDIKAQSHLPPPVVNPSGIARQKLAQAETGMTRGGGRTRAVDQLEWLSKVVKNRSVLDSPDSSAMQSRSGSKVRKGSNGESIEGRGDYISLKEEVLLVNRIFPRPRINFEKIDLHHRKLTISMNGPWANGDRMAFLRIHWSFPATYPYTPEPPTFELERNPTVSIPTRSKLVKTIKEMRAANRQCLLTTSAFLLGSDERIGRRMPDEESDSESEKEVKLANVPMLIRTTGATFGPNGQLVCFFPKQTVLPRVRHISRSPAGYNDPKSPLSRAINALSRLENPRQRNIHRVKARIRAVEALPVAIQSASTLTIHNVFRLGHPDLALAKAYGTSTSLRRNLHIAFDAKRLDHAQLWSTLEGLLSDPPPPYSVHPPRPDFLDRRAERVEWERSMARKQSVLNQILTDLIAVRDIQLLALVGCCILQHVQKNPDPSTPQPLLLKSPEQDYFALPRLSGGSIEMTPSRRRPRKSLTGASTSGWSQILNGSSVSLHTPGQRTSVDITTPIEPTFPDTAGSHGRSIPVPFRISDSQSPRARERTRSGTGIVSASPQYTPLRSAGKSAGNRSSDELRPDLNPQHASVSSHGQSHGSVKNLSSASPMKHSGRTPSEEPVKSIRRPACNVKMEFLSDHSVPGLMTPEMRLQFEGFKLAYADFLLRAELYTLRASLLQFKFLEQETPGTRAASGDLPTSFTPKVRLPSDQKPITVCASCVAKSHKCPACARQPIRPVCTYCHLPIKGLSTCCALCAHRTHHSCYKKHFGTNARTTKCPACLCECVADGGVTIASVSVQPVIQPNPMPSRATGRPSINPLNISTTTNRMGNASLKTIRENEASSDVSALGLSPEESISPPKTADLLPPPSSGWLGWDRGIHWGSREDSPSLSQQDVDAFPTTGPDLRPLNRADDLKGRLFRGREGSTSESLKDGSSIGGRIRLGAFRSGDGKRQGK